jgi:hypothetical protein
MSDIHTQYNLSMVKPKISLQFELSTSGLVSLIKAEAAVEETYTVQEEVEVEDETDATLNTTTTTINTTTSDTNDTVLDDATNATADPAAPPMNETNATTTSNATTTKPKRKVLVDKVSLRRQLS